MTINKAVALLRLAFFVLLLYIWTNNAILFPGEKQGQAKKDYLLEKFDLAADKFLPDVPLVNSIQAALKSLLGTWIDALVAKLKENADAKALQAEIANFFSSAPATTTSLSQ